VATNVRYRRRDDGFDAAVNSSVYSVQRRTFSATGLCKYVLRSNEFPVSWRKLNRSRPS